MTEAETMFAIETGMSALESATGDSKRRILHWMESRWGMYWVNGELGIFADSDSDSELEISGPDGLDVKTDAGVSSSS